jgi:RNA polymerase sigma factor (sigma-70 family)
VYKGSNLKVSSDEFKRSEIETLLIHECQQGNIRSEEKLYRHFYGYVTAISLRYASDKADAQEIVDDTFMKVFSNIGKFDPQQPFKGWLRKITVNTAIDHLRRNKRYVHMIDIDHVSVSSNECAVSKLSAEDLMQMISQLPDLQRFTFNMYEIEGYNHQEIAQQLDITESSSRVYLTRAKQRLRELSEIYFGKGNGR